MTRDLHCIIICWRWITYWNINKLYCWYTWSGTENYLELWQSYLGFVKIGKYDNVTSCVVIRMKSCMIWNKLKKIDISRHKHLCRSVEKHWYPLYYWHHI